MLLVAVPALGWWCVTQLHGFLAVCAPVDADTLVVEGWLPDYALEVVAAIFRQGNYRRIITLGEPLKHGYFLSNYKTYAHLAAATLAALGIDPACITAIPVAQVDRNRTSTTAFALQEWLMLHGVDIATMNLCSLGPHARRSWWLFRRVLPSVKIGVIAVAPQDYDPDRWWHYSAGVRSVMVETIGYVYVRLLGKTV